MSVSKVLVGTVSFTIQFEYLTDLARQGWASGRYKWTIDLLRDSGAPEASWNDIIRGHLKMVTNEDGSGSMSKDNWSPDPNSCVAGIYPDPDEMLEFAEMALAWKKRLDQLSYIEETIQEEPDKMDILDQFMEHERELDTRPTPSAKKAYEIETGWILPDGKAYPCEWLEHDWLAYRLGAGSTKEAEKLGWILLGRSPLARALYAGHRRELGDDAPLTQKQIDALWDWCQMNEVEMPDWIENGR